LIVAQCDYSREMLGGFDIATLDHMFMRIGISAGIPGGYVGWVFMLLFHNFLFRELRNALLVDY
ncbi:hypothetical protein, partial [Paraglaciecola chathamensis]|uniref:hypothetical protein n=1 Tax=Paraglaciecola chathamensis TaxID=368405 RepID=UPI001E393E63